MILGAHLGAISGGAGLAIVGATEDDALAATSIGPPTHIIEGADGAALEDERTMSW